MSLKNLVFEPGELETVSCDLCGEEQSQLLARLSRFQIPINTVVCKGCGHIYHNPRMTESRYNQFYECDYRRLMGEEELDREELFQAQVTHGLSIYKFCQDLVPQGGKVLDIGCATGGQLYVFREEHCCDVVGIEPGVQEAEFANQVKGIPVINGPFDLQNFPEESFDLVIMTQTLNHMLQPRSTLQQVCKALKPSGVLFLEVQDFVHLLRTTPITSASTVDHPNMFHPATLKAILANLGLEVLRDEFDRYHPGAGSMEHGIPSTHMRLVARRRVPRHPTLWPDWQQILSEIRQNQRYQRTHVVPKHYTSVVLRRVAGERGYQAVRRVYHALARR